MLVPKEIVFRETWIHPDHELWEASIFWHYVPGSIEGSYRSRVVAIEFSMFVPFWIQEMMVRATAAAAGEPEVGGAVLRGSGFEVDGVTVVPATPQLNPDGA